MVNHELKPAVFLDRDGTIARDVPYCPGPEQFELLPGVVRAIRILNQRGITAVVITNQSGIARGYFTPDDLARIHHKLHLELAQGNAHLDGIYYCPHHPDDGCLCRKPKPGLFMQAAHELSIDLSRSFMIGDQPKDIEAGKNAGCRTVLISTARPQENDMVPDYTAFDILDAVNWVVSQPDNIHPRGGH